MIQQLDKAITHISTSLHMPVESRQVAGGTGVGGAAVGKDEAQVGALKESLDREQ